MRNRYDFEKLPNVKITGIDIFSLDEKQSELLYTVARYCEAMCDADADAMREIVSEDMTFVHMSGKRQNREEYFDDIEKDRLRYYAIGIEDPVISIDGKDGTIVYTSILDADAYGVRGIFRIKGKHCYELRKNKWIQVYR